MSWTARLGPIFRACGAAYALLSRTYRCRIRRADGSWTTPRQYVFGREIYALSERDALALAWMMRGARFHVLVADGKDGDWAAAMLGALGCTAVRGSSLRNGLYALVVLVRTLRETERPAGVVIDGPLGPPDVAKEGIGIVAAECARPIVPVVAGAEWRLTFAKSWSKIFLPLPFSRVDILLGDPIDVPRKTCRDAASLVSTSLRALREEVA